MQEPRNLFCKISSDDLSGQLVWERSMWGGGVNEGRKMGQDKMGLGDTPLGLKQDRIN